MNRLHQGIECEIARDESLERLVERRPGKPVWIFQVLHHGPQPLGPPAALFEKHTDPLRRIHSFEINPAHDPPQ